MVAPPKAAITRGSALSRLAVGAVLGALRALPWRAQEALAGFVAATAWTLRVRRGVTLHNLAQAYPELPAAAREHIARGAYRTMAVAALDAVTSDLRSDEELTSLIQVPDWKGLDVLLAQRRPVLVACAHFGSWELLGELMSRRGYAISAVVRPLAGAFNEWIVDNRHGAGLELILQRGALRGILSALKRGRAVAQLIDQVLPAAQGVFVPFFGRLASTSPALSLCAQRSGAPVYLALPERTQEGIRLHVEGPFPVPDTGDAAADRLAHVALLTSRLEAAVRRTPEQWLWLHRRWKVQPPSPSGDAPVRSPDATSAPPGPSAPVP